MTHQVTKQEGNLYTHICYSDCIAATADSLQHEATETVTHQLVPAVCGKEGGGREQAEHSGLSERWLCATWSWAYGMAFVKTHRIIQRRE